MDLDFEESLPSHSNLVAPSRNGAGFYDIQERQSADFSQFGYMTSDEMTRPSSPPPPPPPMSAFEDQPVRRMSAPAGKSGPGDRDASKANGKGRPSFPFLKKGSRKEPSALNRSPRSPSSTSPISPSPVENDSNRDGSTFHDSRGLQDVKQRLHDDAADSDEDGGDIFLDGTGYWQVDEMKPTHKPSTQLSSVNTLRESHRNGVSDVLDSSTINIGGEQWQQQHAAGQEELDEFELIERQLENSSLANTLGVVNKSLAHSSHFVSNQANIANTISRPAVVKHSTDDWSDAYEHDSFAKTKNTQREGTQPKPSGYTYQPETSSRADMESEEDEYAEDFNGSDDEDALIYRNDLHKNSTSESGVRQSVSDYIHSTSPPRRGNNTHEHDKNEQEHQDSEEDRPKPSSRPSYSTHWGNASDSLTQDNIDSNADTHARQNSAPAMRATESPSWGRSTQPVGHSFSENEGVGSEQDDSRGGSRGAEGAKMARMSNSALRKISSRTAALHGQGHTPVSRLERPTLADDTSKSNAGDAFSDAEDDDVPPQGVIYTRPTPVRRSLASTHSGPAAVGAGASKGGAKPRSSSTGGRLRPGAVGAGTATGLDASHAALSEKAQALEQELQTYRNENAQLKKLRRQQETTLAEVVHQKEELMRWVAEEKAKTLKWCEEQTQAATKERNAAAKLARDSRQKALTGTMPIRKEKAEMEGLQATIEKMKLDHEAAAKKWKLAEARLYSLIKEHAAHIESSEKQLLAVEQEKLMLLEYIGEQGLRLPKQLRSSLQRAPLYRTSPDGHSSAAKSTTGSSMALDVLRGKSPGNRSKYPGDRGYAEEVDVEFGDATTTVHSAAGARSSGNVASSTSMGRSATPTARSSSVKLSATYQPGEMLNRQSSNLKAGLGATSSGSRVADMIGSGANAGSSWARSSRSSHGSAGRYDNADAEDHSEVFNSTDLGGLKRSQSEESNRVSAPGSSSVKSVSKPTSSCGPLDLPTSSSSISQPKSPGYTASTSFKSNVPASMQQNATINLGATGAAGGGNSRTEETLPDGKKLIKYKNGTQKEIDEAGNSLVRFLNGDTKSVNATSGVVVYYYAQADTTHTTFKDGLEVYEFPNKQVEMHFPDGVKEIIFPDSTRKVINPDGLQESHFPDGVILREHADGRREVLSAKDTE